MLPLGLKDVRIINGCTALVLEGQIAEVDDLAALYVKDRAVSVV